MTTDSKIILALDFPDKAKLLKLTNQLDPAMCHLKIGFESYLRFGSENVENLAAKGFKIFLDLKFHDIPNTVAAACKAAADMGVWLVNVHASGGLRMMEAASDALAGINHPPKLLAVTILTSLTNKDLEQVGFHTNTQEQVLKLALLAKQADVDGVVCSPWEATSLRRYCGDDFLLVTPGIRPEGSEQGDQRRVMTPKEATLAGSDYLVIGRAVTMADDPVAVLEQIQLTLL